MGCEGESRKHSCNTGTQRSRRHPRDMMDRGVPQHIPTPHNILLSFFTYSSNHPTACTNACSFANLAFGVLICPFTANPCSTPPYEKIWYVDFFLLNIASVSWRNATVKISSISASHDVSPSDFEIKRIKTYQRQQYSAAHLHPQVLACRRSSGAPHIQRQSSPRPLVASDKHISRRNSTRLLQAFLRPSLL